LDIIDDCRLHFEETFTCKGIIKLAPKLLGYLILMDTLFFGQSSFFKLKNYERKVY